MLAGYTKTPFEVNELFLDYLKFTSPHDFARAELRRGEVLDVYTHPAGGRCVVVLPRENGPTVDYGDRLVDGPMDRVCLVMDNDPAKLTTKHVELAAGPSPTFELGERIEDIHGQWTVRKRAAFMVEIVNDQGVSKVMDVGDLRVCGKARLVAKVD